MYNIFIYHISHSLEDNFWGWVVVSEFGEMLDLLLAAFLAFPCFSMTSPAFLSSHCFSVVAPGFLFFLLFYACFAFRCFCVNAFVYFSRSLCA